VRLLCLFHDFLWFLVLLLLWLWLWRLLLNHLWFSNLFGLLLGWLRFLLLINQLEVLLHERLRALNDCLILVDRLALGFHIGNIQDLGLDSAGTATLLATLFFFVSIDLFFFVGSGEGLLLLNFGSGSLDDEVGVLAPGDFLRESVGDWRRVAV